MERNYGKTLYWLKYLRIGKMKRLVLAESRVGMSGITYHYDILGFIKRNIKWYLQLKVAKMKSFYGKTL